MKIKLARYIILVMLCVAVLANAAYPASFVYSSQQKRISAGMLSSINGGYNLTALAPWTPFMFYIMEQRLDVKPAGWEFYNPLAPSMQSDGAGNYVKVTKDMPNYWKVDISSPLSDLMKMDVLLIPAQGALSFDRNAREKLRKYVDGGGTLIIDNQGGASFPGFTNPFFIDQIQFRSAAVSAPAKVPNLAHPLVRRPFALNWEDVNKLGIGGLSDVGKNYLSDIGGTISPAEQHFASIITAANNKPIVSAAQYGSGHIVVIATGLGRAICEPVGTTSGLCNNLFMAAQSEDLKFAYNIVNWGSEHTTFHKNARRSGYSFAEIGMPLVPMWEYELTPPVATRSSPAILDDMVFYVDGSGWLHAFDLTSTTDRDGDGSSDDGIRDSSRGAPYDEIWKVNLGEPASSPTVGYIPIGGGAAVPAVLVTTIGGDVYVFDALTGASSGTPIIDGASFAPTTTDIIPAPTYMDGTVYLGDGEGRLWGYNLLTSTEWQSPASGTPTDGCPASGSPIVGCVRDPASGTVDQVVYLAGTGTGSANGNVKSYPLRVFNEVLRRGSQLSTNKWVYNTRTPGGSQITTPYNVYYVDGSGNTTAFPDPMELKASSPPSFELTFNTVPPGSTIIADYVINPNSISARATTPIKVASDLTFDEDGIVGTPALGTNDILHFGTSNGSLYALRETGHGTVRPRIEWRWYLGDPGAKALLDEDIGIPSGSPAVAKDMVYYAVNANNVGYLMAFEADPSFVLDLGLIPGTSINRTKGVRLVQFDTMRAEETQVPVGTTENSPATVDFDAGKITINNFRNGGNASTDLSASQNITVFYYLEGDDVNEIQSAHLAFGTVNPNDKWNNLVWCVKFPNTTVSSSPMVMGDILYAGLADGRLAAIDVEEMRENAGGIPTTPLIWDLTTPAGKIAWKDKGWEEKITDDLDPSLKPIYATVAGTNGVLAVATSKGLAIYHNPVTLVSDGNRLIEFDASGNLLWSCDATTGYVSSAYANPSPPPTNVTVYGAVKVPFNRAAVARRASVGGIIVADTGNDRVVHIDTGGKILWEITSFVDTGSITNSGYPNAPQLPAGSSLTLSRPMDVSMWNTMDANGYPEYHYLIADSGNYRVVEVVARCYDTAAGAYRNELQWTTKTTAQGKQYRYTSARRIFEPEEDPPGTWVWNTKTMCVVSNYEVDSGKQEGPGGALIKIDDSTGLPAIIRITQEGINDSPPPGGAISYKLQNPTFFDRTYISLTEYSDVVVDATALYVTRYDNTDPTDRKSYVRRYTIKDYYDDTALKDGSGDPIPNTGKPLSVSYAQLLPNGNILVSNKATGTIRVPGPTYPGDPSDLVNAAFFGEVFELSWNGTTNKYDYIPPPSGGTNAYEGRQPLSAERLPY